LAASSFAVWATPWAADAAWPATFEASSLAAWVFDVPDPEGTVPAGAAEVVKLWSGPTSDAPNGSVAAVLGVWGHWFSVIGLSFHEGLAGDQEPAVLAVSKQGY
jgi:hypothetical protein